MTKPEPKLGPPDDTPGHLLPAWMSALTFAIGQPEILAHFRRDTGLTWEPGKTSLERAIDEATGIEREFMTRFVEWFNVNIWGPMT